MAARRRSVELKQYRIEALDVGDVLVDSQLELIRQLADRHATPPRTRRQRHRDAQSGAQSFTGLASRALHSMMPRLMRDVSCDVYGR